MGDVVDGTGSAGGTAHRAALRRCVLAVDLLADLDARPDDEGVALGDVRVGWDVLAETVSSLDPLSATARRRVEHLLRLHALVARPGARAALVDAVRLLALPAGHVDHLGASWRHGRVLGGGLDLGLGVLGLLGDPDAVVPLPVSVALVGGLDLSAAWGRAQEHVEDMARLAVVRLSRDAVRGPAILRPVGGCDVLTLLASLSLRQWLADGDGSGLRAVAVPMRTRGWYDLAHVDPAFVGAAWSATEEPARGLPVPLLVTADEVAVARTPDGAPVSAPRRPW